MRSRRTAVNRAQRTQRAGLLRHLDRRRPGRKSGDGPLRRRRAQDRRELPRALHGREGRGQERQAAPLQGLEVPPRHPELHAPGRSATQRLAAMAPSRGRVASTSSPWPSEISRRYEPTQATSRGATARAASRSTARSSPTRTSSSSTRAPACCPWRTRAPARTARSSSSAR